MLVAYAVQSFAGFGGVGIGLNNAMNTDDVLTILGEPVAGTVAASLLLLSVPGLSSAAARAELSRLGLELVAIVALSD